VSVIVIAISAKQSSKAGPARNLDRHGVVRLAMTNAIQVT
jgi:hypothetical protein